MEAVGLVSKNIMLTGFLVLVNILLQSASIILVRYAANETQDESIVQLFLNVFYILAIGCLFLRAIVWQIILKFIELSKVYPMMSWVQVVVFVYGVLILGEQVYVTHVMGLSLMMLGSMFLAMEK